MLEDSVSGFSGEQGCNLSAPQRRAPESKDREVKGDGEADPPFKLALPSGQIHFRVVASLLLRQ